MILLKGFNDFATVHPQLAKEWSERNLPLKPDMVNEKSRKNVWWQCRTCGYEWRSVIHSRVKGAMCPVCADRAVLSGYNDLATTDAHMLSEWDYEKNTDILPESISRSSMNCVWWKCSLNHSWKAKIYERAVCGKGCRVCESDYLSVLPKLAVMYYAGINNLSVQIDSDSIIGIPLETYIAEEKLVIETYKKTEAVDRLKKYLCEKRNIRFINIPYNSGNKVAFLEKVKQAFRRVHIFINSYTEKDAETIKEKFYAWRFKQSEIIRRNRL